MDHPGRPERRGRTDRRPVGLGLNGIATVETARPGDRSVLDLSVHHPDQHFGRSPDQVQVVTEKIERRFAVLGRDVLIYSNVFFAMMIAPEMESILDLSRDLFIGCLLLGLIVVANVMVITTSERKLEIAIRRCEGAKTSDIIAQFVLETAIFCVMGAAAGIILGFALAWMRTTIAPEALMSWAVPWNHVAITVKLLLVLIELFKAVSKKFL